MRLEVEPLMLETRYPFRIARGERISYKNFVFSLTWEGITGLGEASPQAYYGEDENTVTAAVRRLEGKLENGPDTLRERLFTGDLKELLLRDSSVRAALDMALWDIRGKRDGRPCYAALSADPGKTPFTSYTIGFDQPQVVKKKLKDAAPYRILKMKMGIPGDMELLDMVIEASGKIIRVDANEGWDLQTALRIIKELKRRGVEFVEQPISHHNKEDLRKLKSASELPVILDESIIGPENVDECKDLGHGINIKLMKCGGLTPALDMIERARKGGLLVMIGCMIETSLGITAASHLSPLADYADLDGNLLLAEDPFSGVAVEKGKLVLPDAPGLGVKRKGN